jgi:16S rRNA (cytosine967-C5)-methyltransferase
MKLHRPVAEQVIAAITQTFGATEDGRKFHADKVIERIFKNNRKLGGRDRRFIAEATYDIVRWWRLLWASLGRTDASFADRDLWRLLGAWLLVSGTTDELPDWQEFRGITLESVEQNRETFGKNPAVRESFPDWLFDLGTKELGEARWRQCASALNKPAPVVLRVNRLKATREHLQKELNGEDAACAFAPGTEDGLVLAERKNIFLTQSFKLGLFEVQDGASQQAAPLLAPQPGDRVIDGCAGAGGKTLHLAAMMKNKGKIIAMDINQRKLDELRKRCTRAGVDIVETRMIESAKTIKRMEKSADRVLLDVPCSGLGVLRRNPDAKWKLELEHIERLRALQTEILGDYSSMVKKGGHLVYATCSILPSENGDQVRKFLEARATEWKLISERQYWPGENEFDGFYTALLTRA